MICNYSNKNLNYIDESPHYPTPFIVVGFTFGVLPAEILHPNSWDEILQRDFLNWTRKIGQK